MRPSRWLPFPDRPRRQPGSRVFNGGAEDLLTVGSPYLGQHGEGRHLVATDSLN